MPIKNATLLFKWFDQVWNQGNKQAITELFDSEGIAHGVTDENGPKGPEGFEAFYNGFKGQFSNVDISVDEVVSEEDLESARCTVKATHIGSGKDVEFSGICMVRKRNDKIIEAWNHFDFLGLYQQLGHKLVPPQT